MRHERGWPPARTGTQLLQTPSPAVMATCYEDGIVILTADGCVRRHNVRPLHGVQDNAEPKVVCHHPFWFHSVDIDMIASGKEHIMTLGMLLTFCFSIFLCLCSVFRYLISLSLALPLHGRLTHTRMICRWGAALDVGDGNVTGSGGGAKKWRGNGDEQGQV